MSSAADIVGVVVPASALELPRARAVANLLASGKLTFARLVECGKRGGAEVVVFEVDVEVPSAPVHDVRAVERLAAVFVAEEKHYPTCLALREDFPQVPHLNLELFSYPKSLCLYQESWAALRMRWTPVSYVERIRQWLALTARGELHGNDQPLEPMLLLWEHHIVLPSRLFADGQTDQPNRLLVSMVNGGGSLDPPVLLAYPLNHRRGPQSGFKLVATSFRCQPQTHGVIRMTPKSLEELHQMTAAAGLDLHAELSGRMKTWLGQDDLYDALLVLAIWFPKTRSPGGEPEANDVWAFVCRDTIEIIGTRLGVWGRHNSKLGLVMGGAPGSVPPLELNLLNPMFCLTPALAAEYNGYESADTRAFVGVGCGALGSQVLLNLARSGFGTWTLVDADRVFPHNLSRNALDGYAVGHHKATVMAQTMNSLTAGIAVAKSLVADALDAGGAKPQLLEALTGAAWVLDMSASVPVARALAHELAPNTRKASLFLNPSGTDSVLLAEDAAHTAPLDMLEHQLYRAILHDPRLKDHLKRPEGGVRYAQTCRDVTARMAQDAAALHAAIGARAFRSAANRSAASITVWQSAADLSVTRVDVPTSPAVRIDSPDWKLRTDRALLERVASLRASRLPNETGGVLIGSFDLDRRIIYVVDTIPSPPDSEEWPTLYIRGAKGLAASVRAIEEQTGHMLQYVGEWHSHPNGYSCRPSSDDCQVFAWLTELMDQDGFPALMAIAGENDECVFFVGRMVEGQTP